MNKNNLYKVLYAFLLTVFLSGNLFASQADELMKQGNNFYQKKEYEKAIAAYQLLADEGYQGVSLFYNLGNSYYRDGKLGYAILNYEKALRISPNDDDVQHNLAIANARTVDKIDTLPKFFLFQWWESLLALLTVTGWTYLSYIFYILVLLSVGIYFFARNNKLQRYSFFGGFAFSIMLILSIILLIVNLNRELNIKQGIIIKPVISVKLSPDPNSNDAFVIHEGLKVQLEDRVDSWVKIRLHDGKIGWLPKEDVGEI